VVADEEENKKAAKLAGEKEKERERRDRPHATLELIRSILCVVVSVSQF